MESKRKSVQEGDERGSGTVQVRHSKRSREDKSQESDTLSVIRGHRFVVGLTNDLRLLTPILEDLVRKPVKEVLEQILSSRRTFNEVGTCGSKSLELVFKNKLPDKIYTYSKIPCVEIALYDTISNSTVADGPLSCMKIEICVLDGEDEFNKKMLLQRDDKGQLLKGEKLITLKDGVGYISNIQVTDNSSWIKCGQFRLGAKALNEAAINIKEGTSNPFKVLDTRGQSNLKNCAPSLNDEICCLRHIPKNEKTDELLRSHGIRTVKDLLHEHETNPSSLQKKFGKISKKYQEEIIKHAMEAKNADTCIAGATFDRNTHNSYNKEIYENSKYHIPDETIIQEPMKTLRSQAVQYCAHDQILPQCNFSNIAHQEEIYEHVNPQNWSAGPQYDPGTSNIDVSNSQNDEIIANLFLPCGDDGAESSNPFLFFEP